MVKNHFCKVIVEFFQISKTICNISNCLNHNSLKVLLKFKVLKQSNTLTTIRMWVAPHIMHNNFKSV